MPSRRQRALEASQGRPPDGAGNMTPLITIKDSKMMPEVQTEASSVDFFMTLFIDTNRYKPRIWIKTSSYGRWNEIKSSLSTLDLI